MSGGKTGETEWLWILTLRGPTTASNGRATWLGTTFAEEPNSSFNRPVDKFSDFEELTFSGGGQNGQEKNHKINRDVVGCHFGGSTE